MLERMLKNQTSHAENKNSIRSEESDKFKISPYRNGVAVNSSKPSSIRQLRAT